jgi:hypothetical protein
VPEQYWGGIKENSQSIKGARTKLGGMKKNPNDPKILSIKKSKANAMMLKIKRRKGPTLGGTVDHFTNQFQGPEMYEQKKSLGYKH